MVMLAVITGNFVVYFRKNEEPTKCSKCSDKVLSKKEEPATWESSMVISTVHCYENTEDLRYSLINAINNVNYKLQQCTWFYPKMTRDQAKRVLQNKRPGLFLLRHSSSSESNTKYTLDIQASKRLGAKSNIVSVRIKTTRKQREISFRLDCTRSLTDNRLQAGCVVDLIQQLVSTKALDNVCFTDNQGQEHPRVHLDKPVSLIPPSLKHLSRLKLHEYSALTLERSLPTTSLPLSESLIGYLTEYANFV